MAYLFVPIVICWLVVLPAAVVDYYRRRLWRARLQAVDVEIAKQQLRDQISGLAAQYSDFRQAMIRCADRVSALGRSIENFPHAPNA